MSASETESDSEPVLAIDTVPSLTAFAHLSASRLDQSVSTAHWTVSWAVDTLSTLDFGLVRKDAALHDLVQNCASTILAFLGTVLQRKPATDSFALDITSILRPPFLRLLFQYRRLFRVIAARDFQPSSTPLAIVCWVDVVLVRLGDVVALVSAGLAENHPDLSLPESLRVQREEDNLRAAIQLPENWDMLPSMLLSGRVSAAAKRLSLKLMLGRYILCPALSGQADADSAIHKLLSTFAELVRQNAVRVDELRSALGPGVQYILHHERLTSAMAISLFAAADIAQDSIIDPGHANAFRPQTMAAAMQLLRFILHKEEHAVQVNILNPPHYLDTPTSILIQWGIVPRWTWSIWPEYNSLHADTIMCLTTAYIQHHHAGSGPLLGVLDLMSTNSRLSDQAAAISVVTDLLFRFISVLSTGAYSKYISTGTLSLLHGSCRLFSQWMNHNSCGIQCSMECCKALIVLFGYLSQNEQHIALNEMVIECLALMKGQCIREAWKAATEDSNFYFLKALCQSFIQAKRALSKDPPKTREISAQLMQFLVVVMSKGVQPLDLDGCVDFIEAVGERVIGMPPNDREFLCESLLICLAAANMSKVDLPFSKASVAVDDEAIWRLGMCSGGVNLFLASAFSLYITSALVSVEPLTYLEGMEHLLDIALLICSRHYPHEDEPLGLIVLPTICDALAHLLGHRGDVAEIYTKENGRVSALCNILRWLSNGGDEGSMFDGYGALLRRRLGSTASRVLRQMDGERGEDGETRREYELLFCRTLQGCCSQLLYVRVV